MLKWSPNGTFFIIGYINESLEHELKFYDCAGNHIDLLTEGSSKLTSKSLTDSNYKFQDLSFCFSEGVLLFITFEK